MEEDSLAEGEEEAEERVCAGTSVRVEGSGSEMNSTDTRLYSPSQRDEGDEDERGTPPALCCDCLLAESASILSSRLSNAGMRKPDNDRSLRKGQLVGIPRSIVGMGELREDPSA